MKQTTTTTNAEANCPECGEDTLKIHLTPEAITGTNRIRHRYYFECENQVECGFRSVEYKGKQIDHTDISLETAKLESLNETRRAAITRSNRESLRQR